MEKDDQDEINNDNLDSVSDNVSDIKTLLIFIIIFIILNTIIFGGYLLFMFLNGSR